LSREAVNISDASSTSAFQEEAAVAGLGHKQAEVVELRDPHKINWVTTIVLALFHIGAIAAFFFFSWEAVVATLVLHWMCVGWGIGMGYHRLHTHRSYKVPKWMEYMFAVCGSMTLEGGPIFWVATHRLHHQYSDQHGDPHSPNDGVWWAHVGWILLGEAGHNDTKRMARYAPDLGREPFYRWLNTYHYVPLAISGVLLLAFGGISMFLWAFCFRIVFGLHCTWLVNSATHMIGTRRFETKDLSTNSWWVALLTFGEGWHNNHHAHPTSARHGLVWWEIDFTWMQIKLLEKLGIASMIRVARPDQAIPGRRAA
jgi:stearoyl-CoA desaturase (delta-9 desaturase)